MMLNPRAAHGCQPLPMGGFTDRNVGPLKGGSVSSVEVIYFTVSGVDLTWVNFECRILGMFCPQCQVSDENFWQCRVSE